MLILLVLLLLCVPFSFDQAVFIADLSSVCGARFLIVCAERVNAKKQQLKKKGLVLVILRDAHRHATGVLAHHFIKITAAVLSIRSMNEIGKSMSVMSDQ